MLVLNGINAAPVIVQFAELSYLLWHKLVKLALVVVPSPAEHLARTLQLYDVELIKLLILTGLKSGYHCKLPDIGRI
jgi:hypothetical protein